MFELGAVERVRPVVRRIDGLRASVSRANKAIGALHFWLVVGLYRYPDKKTSFRQDPIPYSRKVETFGLLTLNVREV